MKSDPILILERLEYQSIKREELSEEDWKELSEYTELLAERSKGRNYDLEEHPEVTLNEIRLKSFIGSYKFNSGNAIVIRHKQAKLSKEDFSVIAKGIAEWGAMLGSPFLKAILKICSPLTEEYEIALAYSDLLRTYTEIALTEYVPPIIEKRQYVAPVPLGRILVPKTIALMSTGQMQCVSQRFRANIISLPLLLMIRFHTEMVRELTSLEAAFKRDDELPSIQPTRAILGSKIYHRNFLAPEFRQKLLALAFDIDFRNSDILEKIRKQASTSPSISDIVVLWEAFVGQRTLLSKVTDALKAGYALKPVCKLYELWCLRIVVDVLIDLLGDCKAPDSLPGLFMFRKPGLKVEVLYNLTPKESMVVKELRAVGMGVSVRKKPDFTIQFTADSGKKITIILDAKYRHLEGIDDEDLNRLFRYLVDYSEFLGEDRFEGLFFHVSEPSSIHLKAERENPRIAIHLLSLKPKNVCKSKEALRNFFSEMIECCKP